MTRAVPRHIPPTAESMVHQTLAALYQHRMATTDQMHRLLAPQFRREQTARRLARMRAQGLVDRITLPRAGRLRVWFLTRQGADLAAGWPELRDRQPPEIASNALAANLRAAHTLTVVRALVAFVESARARGDEFSPMDWVPEVAHRLYETRDDTVIADALMHYTVNTAEGRDQFRAFLEIDRATMSSERLAAKLISYARFHDHTHEPVGRRGATQVPTMPVWRRFYPVYPRVLFVLTGTGPAGLRNRIEDLKAMVADHPLVAEFARQVPCGAAVLEEIERYGPETAVWTPLHGRDGRCGWTEL